jgi:hypothetical protein
MYPLGDNMATKVAIATLLVVTITISIMGALAASALAQALPDGRIYELVSPAQKSGGVGSVLPSGSLVPSQQLGLPLQSSPDGSGIVYVGEDFYAPHLGSQMNQYLSQRGPRAWLTQNLTPGVPGTSETTDEINRDVGASPDLSENIIAGRGPLGEAEGAPRGYANLYLLNGASLPPLLVKLPPNRTSETFGYAAREGVRRVLGTLGFAGANVGTETAPAFSHVLFAANGTLAPGAVDAGEHANNLYEWTSGGLRLVNVLPNGTSEPDASFGIDYGDEYNNKPKPSLSHVISADGSRIFWTEENGGANNGNLYVREDGERTTLVAAGGQFQTASVDGTRVFFTKGEHLYEYNIDTGARVDLAGGDGVEGVVGASGEGTYVYFVSASALTEGAQVGKPNLYLSHEISAGEHVVSFVATLLPQDNNIEGLYAGGSTPGGDWYRTFAGRTAEVSPDGRYVAFMSQQSLTGYNNADAVRNELDDEVFLFDSATGTLVCASCNTNGSRPTHMTRLPAPANGIYQQRYLDDSGRLFFSTSDSVLPQDTNGLSDVYEYENGHVYLISPGKAEDEAVFGDASESGNDVFFTTREQLVLSDHDQNVDLYDARVEGRPEELPLPPCSGEACHDQALVPSAFEVPVSAAFAGMRNAVPPEPRPVVKPRSLTRAQMLSRALRTCRVRRNRHRRVACEAQVRRRYGPVARRSDSMRSR